MTIDSDDDGCPLLVLPVAWILRLLADVAIDFVCIIGILDNFCLPLLLLISYKITLPTNVVADDENAEANDEIFSLLSFTHLGIRG
jgi:hypothetical protein